MRLFAAEVGKKNNVDVLLDLDFRADQWHDYRAFGLTVRAVLSKVKIAIGTEEEILAATLNTKSQVTIKNQQISAPEITGDIDSSIQALLKLGIETLIVKRGSKGASILGQMVVFKISPVFPSISLMFWVLEMPSLVVFYMEFFRVGICINPAEWEMPWSVCGDKRVC